MKILVFGDRLEVGGSQVNAIELSACLRDRHGHDVLYYATPGPMESLVRQKGLRFLASPHAFRHPSPVRMAALREVVRRERPDVVHAWDWWQCLDAYWAVYLSMGVPLAVSDMNMSISRVLPKEVPTTFGTPELVDMARVAGRRHVSLLLPPVDVQHNAPGAVDEDQFRTTYGIARNETLIATVSRFAANLKAESLRRTVEAMRTLGRHRPVRLALVGDGVLRAELQQLADAVNADLGRPAVLLTGALLDPRPAYAAADVVIGMGGSALRAMAFAKPVVVVGEQGFSAAFTPDSANAFLYKGIFGLGDGAANPLKLVADVEALLEHPSLADLGTFSRQFVVSHYSLETGSARLSAFCETAVAQPAFRVKARDGVRTSAVLVGGAMRRMLSWPPTLLPARAAQLPAK